MDDQAVIRTYGNTNLPEGTADRPLVTFALFAYNQEKYIREAVEGAFSQKYSPLEIIISDDCSKDNTFSIIQGVAEAYKGGHKICIIRNQSNLGLIDHLAEVVKRASGDYVIIAAGDDISLPCRTEMCINHLLKTRKWLVHSDIIPIDKIGNYVEPRTLGRPLLWSSYTTEEACIAQPLYFGATGAFSMKLFNRFTPVKYKRAYEDDVLGFRAILSGGASFIDEKLVKYRMNVGVSSEAKRLEDTSWRSAAQMKMLQAHHDTMLQRLDDYTSLGFQKDAVISAIKHRIHEIEIRLMRRSGWSGLVRLCVTKPILTAKVILNHIWQIKIRPHFKILFPQ